jgi:alanine racemase
MAAMSLLMTPLPDPALASDAVRLTVDLDALRENYRTLAALAAPARTAAVVKADAYGLGAPAIARALVAERCCDFFVAHLSEAESLRPHLPREVAVYILNGLQPGEEAPCAGLGAIPVINSLEQAGNWAQTARRLGRRLPAVVQVDSGMSRLGLSGDDVIRLAADEAFGERVEVVLVMSHLACSETRTHSANAEQRSRFLARAGHLRPAPLSLANSAGVFLGPEYSFNLVRPGLALYGAPPPDTNGAAVRPVVGLSARVVQVRDVPAGQGVGYGLTYHTERPSRIATLSIGYADGWPRRLGGIGRTYVGDVALPIVGRISMDSLTIDATALPEGALRLGALVELLGPHQTLDEVAQSIDAIPYEILTGLGRRHPRLYLEAET